MMGSFCFRQLSFIIFTKMNIAAKYHYCKPEIVEDVSKSFIVKIGIKTAKQIEYKLKSYLHHREFDVDQISVEDINKIINNKIAINENTLSVYPQISSTYTAPTRASGCSRRLRVGGAEDPHKDGNGGARGSRWHQALLPSRYRELQPSHCPGL